MVYRGPSIFEPSGGLDFKSLAIWASKILIRDLYLDGLAIRNANRVDSRSSLRAQRLKKFKNLKS